jgi:hypothetical protein
MNWGTKIAIFYVSFMIVMISLVLMSTQNRFSLVTDAYYEEAIDYESHIIKARNSRELKEPMTIDFVGEANKINLQFPELGKIEGDIHLYRPSSHFMDQHVPIEPDSAGFQTVSTEGLKSGLWRIKVNWEAEGKTYFNEESMFIP